jgi:hypothetical protein
MDFISLLCYNYSVLSDKKSTLPIIGNYEYVELPDFGIKGVPAKIDTGAYRSAIWATNIKVDSITKTVSFCLFGPSSLLYTGKRVTLPLERIGSIKSSSGHTEVRYIVKMGIKLGGKKLRGTFTLANRASHAYPVLVGRRLIYNKFLVDVTKGEPIVRYGKKSALLTKQLLKRS